MFYSIPNSLKIACSDCHQKLKALQAPNARALPHSAKNTFNALVTEAEFIEKRLIDGFLGWGRYNYLPAVWAVGMLAWGITYLEIRSQDTQKYDAMDYVGPATMTLGGTALLGALGYGKRMSNRRLSEIMTKFIENSRQFLEEHQPSSPAVVNIAEMAPTILHSRTLDRRAESEEAASLLAIVVDAKSANGNQPANQPAPRTLSRPAGI